MRMKIAKEEIPTHPVEYLPEDDISALPVLPMTQSADGTWYCDGENTQVVQEQGKNLFDVRDYDGFPDYYSVSDGKLKVLKADNAVISSREGVKLIAGNTYTLSTNSPCQIVICNGVNSIKSGTTPQTFICPDSGKVSISFRSNINAQYPIIVDNVQLELGSEATPYEPFRPKMPSPDYPSPIVNTYPAGTYKAVCGDKVYKVVLDDDLRSVHGVADRVVIDAGRGKLKIEKGIGYIESYTDESVETVYMSSTGELTEGATVIYQLATPTTHQFIPTQLVTIQSGRSAQLLNTVNDKADYLKVGGDSWQLVQEKGANFLDNNPAKWKIGYFISWHPAEGTAWAYGRSMDKACIEIPVSPNTKYGFFNSDTENYWISGIVESDNDGLGYVSHVFYSDISLNVDRYSFISTSNTTKLVFQLSTIPDSDGNYPDITDDFIRDMQITLENGEPTEYTAFQPAMPSPEYQSEIKDVDGTLRSCGWNYYSGSDIEGTQNNNSGTIQTIPPGTYTFMADVESSDTDNTKCFILFYNGTTMLNGVIIGRGKGAQTTVTISENVTKFTCYASNSNLNSLGDTFSFKNIQITQGTTTKPYDRHRGNSITLPTLRGLPDGTRDMLYADRKAKRAWVERKVGLVESYNGESVGDVFMSNTGELSTGAVVHYKLATPVIEELPYSDYLLDTWQYETNINFVDCNENLNPEITAIVKTLGNL